ncbi:flagellar hook-associated protein FlgK [Thalassococcus sp. BH17M4-6]|uniref:flagellar hook-associated protein FlgK n=1 Tax=Thalassococcus sp. BH17M4-6 TaxID=3413148 RepID=UPI003BBA9B21
MSLTGALSNALSGMTANSRAASLVSANIANALTDGYGRRELVTSPSQVGHGGVMVNGVLRHGDPVVLSDRRQSDAGLGFADGLQSYATWAERTIGAADDPGSLTGQIAAFENALITAASNPSSTARLETVARSADAIAQTLNTLSGAVQGKREEADRTIARQVDTINTTLRQVEDLNTQIARTVRLGRDASSLMDSRQRAIDGISDMIPLRSVAREDGVVALFSTGGTVLLDGSATQLDFSPTPVIAPHMTQSGGLLSGITINGRPVDSSGNGPLSGGALAAQFQIRDTEGTGLQAQLDGVARDLIERFGAGGPDATIAPGQPGLFTDAGLAFVPADETGIAGRIALNTAVDPDTGEVWRLRDGLDAATPGEVGNAALLQASHAALGATTVPGSAALDPVARGVSGHVAALTSDVASFRVQTDASVSFAQAQNLALLELELGQGVDTDRELQMLMQIEQNYAANARVMSVVDEMMQAMLRL